MSDTEKSELINKVFSPAKPVEEIELLAGRDKQLNLLDELLSETGQHAVVYGLRGAGKTSLLNVAMQVFESKYFIKTSCLRSDSFDTLWQKALSKISYQETVKKIGFSSEKINANVSFNLPSESKIDIAAVSDLLNETGFPLVFLFDEFDSLLDQNCVQSMADAMKYFSDNNAEITVIIAGIGKNINDLIGKSPSLERCLKQIHVPLLSPEETEQLILERLAILELQIEDEVLETIIDYSSGFPHFAQLLGKYSALQALQSDSDLINIEHFNAAVEKCIESSDFSLSKMYNSAVGESHDNQFRDVLFALAQSETDTDGHFHPETVLRNFNKIRRSAQNVESIYYNLGMLCNPEKGAVLEKTTSSKPKKYRFANPLMKVFIKLKQHAKPA